MFIILDYSSALEYSIIRRYTNIVYYYIIMSVVVNVMLSLMSVMSPPPALCNLSVSTVVKLCTFGGFVLGVSLVS